MEVNKQAKYYQLMEDLKAQIISGNLKAGDKLPSENELADRYKISRQTVRKALAILGNDGYIYAEHGRGTFCSDLVRLHRKSKNIAVVTTYLSDYIFPRVIQGIDEVSTQHGYSIILKNTRNSRSQEAKILGELLQKDIDGMIIEPSKSQIYCRHTELYRKMDEYQIPYVFIQGYFTQMKDKPKVLMDDCKGGYLVTKHLLELGHKKIAGVFKADDMQGQNRYKGYVKALQEAGIAYDPEKVIWYHTEDRTIRPYESMKEMLQSYSDIDGVVCYNDQIAVEIIRAIKAMGKAVPEDISVTGYDNSYIAESGVVKLTSVAHLQETLGAMAAQLLIGLIEGDEEAVAESNILIEPELIIRESTKHRNKE